MNVAPGRRWSILVVMLSIGAGAMPAARSAKAQGVSTMIDALLVSTIDDMADRLGEAARNGDGQAVEAIDGALHDLLSVLQNRRRRHHHRRTDGGAFGDGMTALAAAVDGGIGPVQASDVGLLDQVDTSSVDQNPSMGQNPSPSPTTGFSQLTQTTPSPPARSGKAGCGMGAFGAGLVGFSRHQESRHHTERRNERDGSGQASEHERRERREDRERQESRERGEGRDARERHEGRERSDRHDGREGGRDDRCRCACAFGEGMSKVAHARGHERTGTGNRTGTIGKDTKRGSEIGPTGGKTQNPKEILYGRDGLIQHGKVAADVSGNKTGLATLPARKEPWLARRSQQDGVTGRGRPVRGVAGSKVGAQVGTQIAKTGRTGAQASIAKHAAMPAARTPSRQVGAHAARVGGNGVRAATSSSVQKATGQAAHSRVPNNTARVASAAAASRGAAPAIAYHRAAPSAAPVAAQRGSGYRPSAAPAPRRSTPARKK